MAYEDDEYEDDYVEEDTEDEPVAAAPEPVAAPEEDDWEPYKPPEATTAPPPPPEPQAELEPEPEPKPVQYAAADTGTKTDAATYVPPADTSKVDDWEPYKPPATAGAPAVAAKPQDDWEPYRPEDAEKPRGLAERMSEGWKGGFGTQPLGISPENLEKYPGWLPAQPFAAGADAFFRAFPGLAGLASGWVAGVLERNPESKFPYGISRAEADRMQRDLKIMGEGLMVEPGLGLAGAHPPTGANALARGARDLPERPPAPPVTPEPPPPPQGQLPFGRDTSTAPLPFDAKGPPQMTQADWNRQAVLAEQSNRPTFTSAERAEYNALIQKEAAAREAKPQQPQIGGGESQPGLPLERPAAPEVRAGPSVQPEIPFAPPVVESGGQLGFNVTAPPGRGIPQTTYRNGVWETETTSRPAMPAGAGTAKEMAPPATPRQEMERRPYSTEVEGRKAVTRGDQPQQAAGINVLQPGQVDPTLAATRQPELTSRPSGPYGPEHPPQPPPGPPRTSFEPPRTPVPPVHDRPITPIPRNQQMVVRPPDSTQAMMQEPVVKPGMTRLYRTDPRSTGFTTDRAIAEQYGPLHHVDVNQGQLAGQFQPGPTPGSYRGHQIWATPEWQRKLQPTRETPTQPTQRQWPAQRQPPPPPAGGQPPGPPPPPARGGPAAGGGRPPEPRMATRGLDEQINAAVGRVVWHPEPPAAPARAPAPAPAPGPARPGAGAARPVPQKTGVATPVDKTGTPVPAAARPDWNKINQDRYDAARKKQESDYASLSAAQKKFFDAAASPKGGEPGISHSEHMRIATTAKSVKEARAMAAESAKPENMAARMKARNPELYPDRSKSAAAGKSEKQVAVSQKPAPAAEPPAKFKFEEDDPGNLKPREKFYNVKDADGNEVAQAYIRFDGKTAIVRDIYSAKGKGSLGTAQMREVFDAFKAAHPDVNLVTGKRVTGARAKAPAEAQEASVAVKAKTTKPIDPDSLSAVEFLASKGGISPDAKGDLMAALGEKNPYFRQFSTSLVNKKRGLAPDQARQALVDAGYLSDEGARSGGKSETDLNSLYRILSDELGPNGKRQMRLGAEPSKSALKAEDARIADENAAHAERVADVEKSVDKYLADPDNSLEGFEDGMRQRMYDLIEEGKARDPASAYEQAVKEADAGRLPAEEPTPKPAPEPKGPAPRRSTDPDSIMQLARNHIEDVPIAWLRQLPGNKFRAGDAEITQLGKDITADGMRDPLIINVGKDSRTAELGEGNHRLEALAREGYTHVPARVIVGNNWGKAKGHNVDLDLIPKSGEYFSGDAKPSDVFKSLGERKPAAEKGADNKPQEVIPGAEKAPDKALAQRAADRPLQPKTSQKGSDFGMFADRQEDLMDLVAKPKAEADKTGRPGRKVLPNGKTVAQQKMIDEAHADAVREGRVVEKNDFPEGFTATLNEKGRYDLREGDKLIRSYPSREYAIEAAKKHVENRAAAKEEPSAKLPADDAGAREPTIRGKPVHTDIEKAIDGLNDGSIAQAPGDRKNLTGAGFCYPSAAREVTENGGHYVLGITNHEIGKPTYHGVAEHVEGGKTYYKDGTLNYDGWFEKSVYEKLLGGFEPVKRLTPDEVKQHGRASGFWPDPPSLGMPKNPADAMPKAAAAKAEPKIYPATEEFAQAQKDYRARKIGDEEFIAAKDKYAAWLKETGDKGRPVTDKKGSLSDAIKAVIKDEKGGGRPEDIGKAIKAFFADERGALFPKKPTAGPPAKPNVVVTHLGTEFKGATIHEAAVFARGAGFKPHQIFTTDGKAYTPPSATASAGGGRPPGGTGTPPPGATPPAGKPQQVISRLPEGKLRDAANTAAGKIMDIGHEIQMAVAPMARGTQEAMASAKDFANSLRLNRQEWTWADEHLEKNFTPAERRAMWEAADAESVAKQTGKEAKDGLASLPRDQRAAVEAVQARSRAAWDQARELDMVNTQGLPAYTPRMLINLVGGSGEKGPARLDPIGLNLRTRTGQMKHREHLTAAETEAAGKAKFGEQAELVRDIRTLPLATGKLEDAIAGRKLIDSIRDAGRRTGDATVVEGGKPAGSPDKWFTIDHPSFKVWRSTKGADGSVSFREIPLYVRGEFEGPLRAVLSTESGMIYRGAMELKGKTMSLIMNSPLIHNAVEWGRAMPAMPGKVLTFKVYFEGNRAKKDKPTMREAINDGLVPIGGRGYMQDINAIMESPNLKPGRSWTAQALAYAPGKMKAEWGESIKRGVDTAGDFWHNKLLWDRIGDLQMGLYVNFRDSLIAEKGMDRQSASRTAAHWANRYAGALPQEAMSSLAHKTANMLLFSRSFTMGNLGAMKDMINGLPRDVRAQITRDVGKLDPKAEGAIKSIARRKAVAIIALDVGLMYVMNSALQSMSNVIRGEKTLGEEGQGYADRLAGMAGHVVEHPLSLLQPFHLMEGLSATSENEPGKQDRVMIGYTADGQAIYARNPVGKIGEEFTGWASNPLDMFKKKMSTTARPVWQLMSNDKGFGRKVYDPQASTIDEKGKNALKIIEHLAMAQTPEIQLKGAKDLVTGEGDKKLNTLQTLGPIAGMTFSRGAPGGPAMGELYRAREKYQYKVSDELPEIRRMIKRGDLDGAIDRMTELGIARPLQRFYIRTTENPETRLSPKLQKDFERYATPEEKERFRKQLERQGIR